MCSSRSTFSSVEQSPAEKIKPGIIFWKLGCNVAPKTFSFFYFCFSSAIDELCSYNLKLPQTMERALNKNSHGWFGYYLEKCAEKFNSGNSS